jgi:hypothetical protein
MVYYLKITMHQAQMTLEKYIKYKESGLKEYSVN